MFNINATTAFSRQLNIRAETKWRANSVSTVTAVLLMLTAPAWGQGDSDYLNAMDKASGNKEQSSTDTSSAGTGEEEKFLESESRIEIKSLLSASYPEEFALYKKFDAARKNEVIAAFDSTQGKAENVRMMRVINKIGLMGDAGGWSY